MYVGFNSEREFTTADISASLKRQVPLSVSQRETIDALRDWLQAGRCNRPLFQKTVKFPRRPVPKPGCRKRGSSRCRAVWE